jgi:DNA-binding CsgD family transcriptional regulator
MEELNLFAATSDKGQFPERAREKRLPHVGLRLRTARPMPHGEPMAKRFDADADFWNPIDLLHRTRAADAKSAWGILDAALTRAGFQQSFYAFGVPMTAKQPLLEKFKRGIFGGGRFVNEFFPELVRRPSLLAKDPVAPHCKRSLQPFVWSCAELKPRDKSILAFAYDFDLSAFIVLPLRSADATHYGNFTIFCSDARHKSWLRHAQRFGPLLHITAQYFHDTLSGHDSDALDASRFALSPRQSECLLWASHGLSTKQIAERLTLSDPVVNEYLGTAKRKLGCATRAHAVARAIRFGLIRP